MSIFISVSELGELCTVCSLPVSNSANKVVTSWACGFAASVSVCMRMFPTLFSMLRAKIIVFSTQLLTATLLDVNEPWLESTMQKS